MTYPIPDTLPPRFRAKLIAAPSGCWIWTANRDKDGYGGYRPSPQIGKVRAHRFAYELLVGPIPDGLTIDHLCRVRRCVNPMHLQPVTDKENVLRGLGISAQNARKTHCSKGHPFDEQNTKVRNCGRRRCRTCFNARDRELKQLRKQVREATA